MHHANTTEVLTTSDVARILEVTPATVRLLARQGKLQALRAGRQGTRFYLLKHVLEFQREREECAGRKKR